MLYIHEGIYRVGDFLIMTSLVKGKELVGVGCLVDAIICKRASLIYIRDLFSTHQILFKLAHSIKGSKEQKMTGMVFRAGKKMGLRTKVQGDAEVNNK